MAARAHDVVAALTIKGSFAILNFPHLAPTTPSPPIKNTYWILEPRMKIVKEILGLGDDGGDKIDDDWGGLEDGGERLMMEQVVVRMAKLRECWILHSSRLQHNPSHA
ncbi:hypothetical protein PIB30_020900 [Stylosanthes scabra]|uniref:Uncharacterized protein n=1 Tax=Stylosanthes scabra TaxID=79078 RepID=A0ABU6Y7L9_9FABA|nr:hypothetical protein [Stylosanthes scabra]